MSNFNPLPSCEGRRRHWLQHHQRRNISIHSPHARGDAALGFDWTLFFISIHSPHARGDTRSNGNVWLQKISIHSPHARGDSAALFSSFDAVAFQSTPLMRGRPPSSFAPSVDASISIHSPHARGDDIGYRMAEINGISIHSPHARGDGCVSIWMPFLLNFNPLPSCEGRRVIRS